jgi:hypothetical protein
VGDISNHALFLEVTLKHQKAKDYKFSRSACYHVALALGYADPAATISKKVSEQNKSVAELATPGGIHS